MERTYQIKKLVDLDRFSKHNSNEKYSDTNIDHLYINETENNKHKTTKNTDITPSKDYQSSEYDEFNYSCPSYIIKLINYARKLDFESDIDYNMLRNLITCDLSKQNLSKIEFNYDWLNFSEDSIISQKNNLNLTDKDINEHLKIMSVQKF